MKKIKYIYILICYTLLFISCDRIKGTSTNTNEIDILKKTSKKIKKQDFLKNLERKINDKYVLINVNSSDNFQNILNDFMELNKKLFNCCLTSEREVIFNDKKTNLNIYIREWTFKSLSQVEEVKIIINKPTREELINGKKIIIDTIKEPYFTYQKGNKLYVFYAKTVSMAYQIRYFKKILIR